jgi:serine/threonine protein kinase
MSLISLGAQMYDCSDGPRLLQRPLVGEQPGPTDLTQRLEVGELLGQGGMAEVYAAVERSTGRRVALKRVIPKLAVRSGLRLRFANEVDLLDLCRGPYVLELVSSGVWADTPAYVCERCAGSLSDLARESVLPLPQVLRIASDILTALDRVHAVGAVHRDIKPSNILLTDDGSVRLADFGIARHPTRRLTAVGHTVGTPCYSAPDLVENPRMAEPAHDLYSVGLLILAVSTHMRTRALVDPAERAATLARFPLDTRILLDRATSPDRGARYRSAAEMVIEVQHVLATL